ncbi:energy transducer TonB [Salinicola sp. V024]|uniref:energy transducer TonB n=1 Tax=Salinicola sp. V024 TaxID=3459609 RepID=UPI004044FD18
MIAIETAPPLQGSVQKNNRSISRPEIWVLVAISVLVHGLIWWSLNRQPMVAAEVLSNQASQASEVTVMLTSAPPPPPPPPPPVEPPPPPPPVQEAPVVDDVAVTPAEEKVAPEPEPEPKPKPEPKPEPKPQPKPQPKPEPKPKPQPKPEPKPTPQKSTPTPQQTQPSKPAPSQSTASSNKVTPAVSGMQSLGNPPPRYPSLALRRGYEGNVQLQILVMPDGTAGQVKVTQSSGHRELDEAAIETVRSWTFKPARRGDTPIKGWALQTIAFQLPN